MAKSAFHPKAYLAKKRNVRRGLLSRTGVLRTLEGRSIHANSIAREAELSYRVVLYHLRLLENEGIVSREGNTKPFSWRLTGIGQQRL